MDGFEVLRELRARGCVVPVIMLTARSSTRDTVEGLECRRERLRAEAVHLRGAPRARAIAAARERPAGVGVSVATATSCSTSSARRATVDGREVELSAREFALAEQFLRNPGRVLSREQLLSRVWGMDFDPGSNVVDVYVRYLRGKLGADHIVTVRGAGYRWE